MRRTALRPPRAVSSSPSSTSRSPDRPRNAGGRWAAIPHPYPQPSARHRGQGCDPGSCPDATARDRGQSATVITNARNISSTPVAIVTGGSRGIGRAIARRLAIAEYAVAINCLSSPSLADAAVEEILAASGTAVAVCADVADELDVERLFGETIEAFGGVDVVVHVAARATFVVNQRASLELR